MREGLRPGRETRDAARPGSRLWTYLTVVILAGVAVLVITLLGLDGGDLRILVAEPVFWIVAGLIVFGELRAIVLPGWRDEDAVRTSGMFTFAVLLYVGLPVAIALQTLATVVMGVATRKSPFRTVFNVGQYALSFGAAGMVLHLAGIHPSPSDPWVVEGGQLVVVALAAGAYFVANDGLVGAAVALLERQPILATLRADLGFQVVANLALLGLSPLVVLAMDRSGALLPLFVLPLMAMYLNASVSMRREHQALHDELTGLPNRKFLIRRTGEVLSEAGRDGRVVGLLLLDLDRFKEVNDTLGHPVGDRLLCLIGARLEHSIHPGDVVGRLGGDEFAVLLPGVRGAVAAREAARRLRAAVSEPFRLEGMLFDLEASIGIALYPDHAPEFESLLQRADVAMYLAKEARSGVEVYDVDKDRNSPARLGLLGELRRGLDRGEFELHYQPKVSLAGGAVVGLEGLIRWRHPRRGLVPPDEFIPLAEQSYLMGDLTRYVVETALAQLAQWWDIGYQVPVAVNISARDLMDSGLADVIAAGLVRHDVPAEALQMEVTERILMTEPAHAAETIAALAELGVPLSLDDFGTGYSSLVHLKRLPVQELKVDASFVRRMADDADDAVIVRSIIDLARALGLRSVAEGVETAEILEGLRDMRCDAAQGWHLSYPMDSGTATRWLADAFRAASSVRALRGVETG
ncbi:MAG: putative bifunctional diguanylate cyclase/phosphodiesterase [Streptosporangiaceae bacterium]